MTLAWPVRSVLAGSAGTATMTLAYAGERWLRRNGHTGPLDHDDSLVPGKIVATVMHLPQGMDHGDRELGCYVAAVTGVEDAVRRTERS